jgi:serine/threonine protein phosphatase 1
MVFGWLKGRLKSGAGATAGGLAKGASSGASSGQPKGPSKPATSKASEAVSLVAPDGQRVYAIGDIHGCSALLDRMHALIRADLSASPIAEPGIIYLGDYCDRGPDSAGVYQRLADPAPDLPPAIALKGNHEEMFEQFIQKPEVFSAWRELGGLETLASYGVDPKLVLMKRDFTAARDVLLQRMPDRQRDFIASLATSFEWGPYYFCHAGVRPGVPLARQAQADLLWIRHEFLNFPHDHGRRIVHGHTPCERPEVLPNRINVDTGAYATGRLTAVVLERDQVRWLQT